MQLATQRAAKAAPGRRTPKDARAATIAAIHITWKKLRPDLRHDKDDLRESRLQFMSRVLKRDVTSSRDLTQSKLGKVLDAMRELERAPLLPGAIQERGQARLPNHEATPGDAAQVGMSPGQEGGLAPAAVHHLATEAQVAVINKLVLDLGWSLEAFDGFLLRRFKTKSHRMLTPQKANSLTMILFTIAASRDIKRRWKQETGSEADRVSREMIRAEIPALKRRLGIDQKPSADSAEEEE